MALLLTWASSCSGSAQGPITKLVEPVDVKTGWFDAGVEDGKNKLVPTIILALKNISSEQVANVQLNAVIRRVGETEEWGGAFQKVIGTDGIPPGGSTETYRAAFEPRIHWHRTARADAEEQPVRRRSGPGICQARRQSVDEAGRVADRARVAHSVALGAFSDTNIS